MEKKKKKDHNAYTKESQARTAKGIIPKFAPESEKKFGLDSTFFSQLLPLEKKFGSRYMYKQIVL